MIVLTTWLFVGVLELALVLAILVYSNHALGGVVACTSTRRLSHVIFVIRVVQTLVSPIDEVVCVDGIANEVLAHVDDTITFV